MWRALSILFGCALCAAASGQIYEWFDEHGNRHFTDQKPDGVAYRTLGDPAENLSSYAPSAIRRAPASPSGETNSSSSRKPRRSENTKKRADIKAVCADYLHKIDRIQQQLRAGYREPRGNRLRARRSALQAAYRDECG